MNSLFDLNSFSRTILEVTDDRPAGVVLDRPGDVIVDQRVTFTSTSVTVPNAADIREIINYPLANVRVKFTIYRPAPSLPSASLSWPVIPSGVTLTQVGDVYELSGITTVDQWEAIKNPTWTVNASYASYPVWFVTAEIIWYDGTLLTETRVEWDVYDERFFYFADIETKATISCDFDRIRATAVPLSVVSDFYFLYSDVYMPANANLTCEVKKYKGIIQNLQANAGVVTTVVTDFLTLNYNVAGSTTISFEIDNLLEPVRIAWGDGTQNTYSTSGTKTHTYTLGGTYKVSFVGRFGKFRNFSNQLTRVKSFGTSLTNLSYAFANTTNIVEMASNLPSTVTNLSYCFTSSNFNLPSILNWNITNVTNLEGMFQYNTSFNQPIGVWNTINVTNTKNLFSGATAFNQPLNNWNVSKVTDASGMFSTASSFNQPLNNWNVSNLVNATAMFAFTPFNQDITGWNVSNVVAMSDMFRYSSFNQPIGVWNVSNVQGLSGTFDGNTAFNQPLNNWNVSNVTSMARLFRASNYNQPLNNWNVSKVQRFDSMFASSQFNQNISNWNVSSAIGMYGMFESSVFNQPINAWNVSKVISMAAMFKGSQFNQDLNLWDVRNVYDRITGEFGGVAGGMYAMFQNAAFNKNISNWCVINIPTKPGNFDTGTSWASQFKPVWGTCP